jgi:hypothetical protein
VRRLGKGMSAKYRRVKMDRYRRNFYVKIKINRKYDCPSWWKH